MLGEIETVLTALNETRTRYLVVGGVAVVLHGKLRTTADLDLVVECEAENVARAVKALHRVGFRPRTPAIAESFADDSVFRPWADEPALTVCSLRSPAHRDFEVDLFPAVPFDFDAIHGRANRVPVRSTGAFIPAIEDLIAIERAGGRGHDLDDVAALEALRHRPHTSRDDECGSGWEGHARRQACLGLELTPSERLEWLDRALKQMREILGAAAHVAPHVTRPPAPPN